MKKTLVISIVVLMMAALGANVVGAQEPGGQQFGNRGPREGGVMDVVSEATGLSVQEIFEALQEDGATLASVIEANGGDVAAIRATLIENATARLDEQAAGLEEHIDNLLNGEFAANRGGRGPGGRGPGGFGGERLETLAGLLGTEVDDLRESLHDGMTIAEIAEANGVDVQTVIDALVAAAEERLDEAVANGRVSEEDAEAHRAELAERISEFVNNGFDGERGGRFGGPRGGRGPGGPGGPGGNADGNDA